MKSYSKHNDEINSHCTVKEMATEDQPREKLQKYGAETLTNAELLAILLRTGTKKQNVLDLSRHILNYYGGLHQVARKNWKELRLISGVANVKALTLEAVFELARRLSIDSDQPKISLKSPADVASYFGPKLRDSSKERFLVIFLNNASHVITYEQISFGSKYGTVVDVSDVMRLSLIHDATSIILCHNHPSGVKKASNQDVEITNKIKKAAETLHIRLNDHIIICGRDYFSFTEEGLL